MASPRDRMLAKALRLLALGICLCVTLTVVAEAADVSDHAADRRFTLRILPLMKAKCFGCHGSDENEIRGGFNMLTREGLLKGGESGEPSLVPGHPDESVLVQAIMWEGYEMPPKENDRLSASEVDEFREWIAAGAPWPSLKVQEQIRLTERTAKSNEEGRIVATSGGTSDEWTYRRYQPEDLWAFDQLPAKSNLIPNVGLSTSEAIDYFLDLRMRESKLAVAPMAKPRVLIRRATFDLTGLPPTPEEIKEFENAWSHDADAAWAELIERLLASPRYGEHWGRHWLDVTRYADTGGMSNDYERSNMWRYRDYVIRSFNQDKPYHEFVVEQLAGDELTDQSVMLRVDGDVERAREVQLQGDYTEQESEWIVATGFLRLGPWDNAMVEADEARQIYLDDLVNITGQTFLAQTLRCCKCHDHKFDPIPTRDYYRIYAAFSTTHMAERPVPHLAEESREGFEEGRAHVQRMLDFAVAEKNRLIGKREAAARVWFDEHDLPYRNEKDRRELPDDQKPPRHVGLDHVEQGQLKVREQDEWIWTRRLERYQPMAQSIYNAASANLAWNGARKLRIDRKAKRSDPLVSHILNGGALTATGDVVQPGVLSALEVPVDEGADDPFLVTSAVDGRRLGLAKWIADPANGLTSRAIVNRIWQYHFGTGLAANSNNFGAKGAKPTHPKLLNYLALDFTEHGSTIKRMHRAIMSSSAYRRAASPVDVERVAELDPNNRLLTYFPRRRLSAEELRDSLLSVTGELAHRNGGLPVKPEINMEVALQPRMIQFSLAPAYQPSRTPQQRNARTVYAYHVRGQADPFTELFNQPNPNESCELRESAAVTPQVFTLLNSDMMIDRSIALALRLEKEASRVTDQVQRAFQLVMGRDATEDEAKGLEKYVAEMRDYHAGVQPESVTYPTEVTRSLVEEFSGRPFEYREVLPVFERYVADPKPGDVSAKTRALADLCLVLLNTNEFMYIE